MPTKPIPSAPVPRPASAVDDAELVGRIARHDQAAFEVLMRRHNSKLFRVARAILKDDAEAEDALQDAGPPRERRDSNLHLMFIRWCGVFVSQGAPPPTAE